MDPTFLILIAIMFGVMWLMSSRTRKQQREAAALRANLTVGQEVMTGSGMLGTVVAVDDDEITLESTPGNQSRWLRAAVLRVVVPAVEDDTASSDDDSTTVDDVDDDQPIEVPDDLSTLPPARGDDKPEKK